MPVLNFETIDQLSASPTSKIRFGRCAKIVMFNNYSSLG